MINAHIITSDSGLLILKYLWVFLLWVCRERFFETYGQIQRGIRHRALTCMLSFASRVKAHTFPIDCCKLAHNLIVETDLFHHYFSELAIFYLSSIIYQKVWIMTERQYRYTLLRCRGRCTAPTCNALTLLISKRWKQGFNVIIKLFLSCTHHIMAFSLAVRANWERIRLLFRSYQVSSRCLNAVVCDEK